MRKFLFFLLLLIVPTSLGALPDKPLVYTPVASQSANEGTIEKGIEAAISDMSFITKPIARTKLKKSNLAFKKITFKKSGKKVSIQHDDRKTVDSPADGSKVKWTREDGETFTVSQKVEDTQITQVFYADEGNKTLVYKFSDDFSQVSVSVRLDSPKLPAPLKYTLKYKQ